MARGTGPVVVGFDFPLKGHNKNFPPSGQPRGTSADLSNVRPFDTGNGRASGGRRPGTSKAVPNLYSGPVRAVQQTVVPGANYTAQSLVFNNAADVQIEQGTTGTVLYWDDATAPVVPPHGSYLHHWRSSIGSAGDTTGLATAQDKHGWYQTDHPVPSGEGAADTYRATCYTNAFVTPPRYRFQVAFGYWVGGPGGNLNVDPYTYQWDVSVLLRCNKADYGDKTKVVQVRLVCNTDGTNTLTAVKNGATLATASNVNLRSLDGDYRFGIYVWCDVGGGKMDVYVQNRKVMSAVAVGTDAPASQTVGVASKRWIDNTGSSPWTNGSLYNAPGFGNVQMTVLTEAVRQRSVKMYGAAGADILIGDLSQFIVATAGALDKTAQVTCCDTDGKAYFLDGTGTKVMDLSTGVVSDHAATAGKGDVPAGCRICCTWRGRLVLANNPGFEQNVYLSRQGDAADWLFGQDDEGSAVALNAATAGHVGQPVFCLIPFRDDVLIIGGDHSTYALVGDPAAGGTLSTLSDSIGILGPNAWTQDPEGNIYFVGTGGFFRMTAANQPPVNLSEGSVNEFFRSIDRGRSVISLAWDRDGHGCWIFVSPVNGSPWYSSALWWDARTQGFFPCAFPSNQTPLCVSVVDGDGAADRYMLLGCPDGYLRKLTGDAADDDGTPIVSYVTIGPVQPYGPYNEAQLMGWEVVFGQGTASDLQIDVQWGPDADAALNLFGVGNIGTYTGANGRQGRRHNRYRGSAFYARLSSAGYWNLDRLAATASPGGPQR
jgi:hypothetical protein